MPDDGEPPLSEFLWDLGLILGVVLLTFALFFVPRYL
jgi:hypothetical protein